MYTHKKIMLLSCIAVSAAFANAQTADYNIGNLQSTINFASTHHEATLFESSGGEIEIDDLSNFHTRARVVGEITFPKISGNNFRNIMLKTDKAPEYILALDSSKKMPVELGLMIKNIAVCSGDTWSTEDGQKKVIKITAEYTTISKDCQFDAPFKNTVYVKAVSDQSQALPGIYNLNQLLTVAPAV